MTKSLISKAWSWKTSDAGQLIFLHYFSFMLKNCCVFCQVLHKYLLTYKGMYLLCLILGQAPNARSLRESAAAWRHQLHNVKLAERHQCLWEAPQTSGEALCSCRALSMHIMNVMKSCQESGQMNNKLFSPMFRRICLWGFPCKATTAAVPPMSGSMPPMRELMNLKIALRK